MTFWWNKDLMVNLYVDLKRVKDNLIPFLSFKYLHMKVSQGHEINLP